MGDVNGDGKPDVIRGQQKGRAVKLPADALIAPEQISGYLLCWRPEDDKSAMLRMLFSRICQSIPEKGAEVYAQPRAC